LGSLSPEIVFCLVAVWMLMFLCIFKGVNVVSKVVLWTVPLPWLMLVILMVRGLTLPGATQGLAYYMNPDWSQLAQPTTWRFAFGQVFFSMSLAFGVMITYASFLHRKSDINNNAAIIGLGDLGTSFVAGIAIFATLGAMSVATSVPVPEVVGEGTVGMAFMAFPYALAQLPYSAWFALVFFLALMTLGIDSAFSITESVLASIVDKTGWNRTTTLWGMTFVGLACGIVYTSRGGLAWLEEIDGFVNGPWGIALLGMVECVVLGWMFRIKRLRDHANERSDWKLGVWWDWNLRLLVPVVLSALFVWSLYDTITAYDGYLVTHGGQAIWPVIVGLGLAGLAPILAILLSIIRFRPREEEAKITLFDAKPDEATDTTQTRLAFYATLVALLLVGALGTVTVASKLQYNDLTHAAMQSDPSLSKAGATSQAVTHGLAWDLPAALMPMGFTLAAALAVLGVIAGVKATKQADTSEKKPHWTGQFAGAFGTLAFGGAGGLLLAFLTMQGAVTKQKVEHTSELNVWAYVIMAVMLSILVLGLGWCFYRAMTAARSEAVEEQTSEL
jgi:NSS family neurotransmitter:Na+ symporter